VVATNQLDPVPEGEAGSCSADEPGLATPGAPDDIGDEEPSSFAAAAFTVVTVCPAGAGWVIHHTSGAAAIKASPAARPVAAWRRDILGRAGARSPDGSVSASGPGRGDGRR
jgi:hypothetical protein